MSLAQELTSEVGAIFRDSWTTRDGYVVPSDDSLKLYNDAVKLNATVLYADLADSTKMVDAHSAAFAAEIYKAFLHCAAKIIRSEGGSITAYDGDRVMAVFMGDSKNTQSVRTAWKINKAMQSIVLPAKQNIYSTNQYTPRHVVGIDTSDLFVARTGVRGANDLVWVGRAANYAAKLAALPESYTTYITAEVYSQLHDTAKFAVNSGINLWEAARWDNFDNRIIYRSNAHWTALD